jgi:hypothetical protein
MPTTFLLTDSGGGYSKQLAVQMADVTGVCVVVSRWFGGVNLGPSRFAIINNTARTLLIREGFMSSGATHTKGQK